MWFVSVLFHKFNGQRISHHFLKAFLMTYSYLWRVLSQENILHALWMNVFLLNVWFVVYNFVLKLGKSEKKSKLMVCKYVSLENNKNNYLILKEVLDFEQIVCNAQLGYFNFTSISHTNGKWSGMSITIAIMPYSS
jgi:hypothetical protein